MRTNQGQSEVRSNYYRLPSGEVQIFNHEGREDHEGRFRYVRSVFVNFAAFVPLTNLFLHFVPFVSRAGP